MSTLSREQDFVKEIIWVNKRFQYNVQPDKAGTKQMVSFCFHYAKNFI